MVDNAKLVEIPIQAGERIQLNLEAFTRKIIALIKGRVKYFFAQFGNFKIGRVAYKPQE